ELRHTPPPSAPKAIEPRMAHARLVRRFTSGAPANVHRTTCSAVVNTTISTRTTRTDTASTNSVTGPRARVSAMSAIVVNGDVLATIAASSAAIASRAGRVAAGI